MPASQIAAFKLDAAMTGAVLAGVDYTFACQTNKLPNEDGDIVDRADYAEEKSVVVRGAIKKTSPWDPSLMAALALSTETDAPNYHSGSLTAGSMYINSVRQSRAVQQFRQIEVSADGNPGVPAA